MKKKQDKFENLVIKESELNMYNSISGEIKPFIIDGLYEKFYTADEVIMDSEQDLIDNRKKLNIYIQYKFSKLNKIQRIVAELKYYDGLSTQNIADKLKKHVTTIYYYLKQIDDLWCN